MKQNSSKVNQTPDSESGGSSAGPQSQKRGATERVQAYSPPHLIRLGTCTTEANFDTGGDGGPTVLMTAS